MINITSKEFFHFAIKNKNYFFKTLLLLIFICYILSFSAPRIDVTVKIHDVTDQDYNIFINNNDGIPLEKKTKDNCRFISIALKTTKPLFIVNSLKLENNSLRRYLEDKIYFENINNTNFLGQYTFSDNNEYAEGIDVYMDGMIDEKLKDFFSDYKIEVTWFHLLTGKEKEIFYLKDYFQ